MGVAQQMFQTERKAKEKKKEEELTREQGLLIKPRDQGVGSQAGTKNGSLWACIHQRDMRRGKNQDTWLNTQIRI